MSWMLYIFVVEDDFEIGMLIKWYFIVNDFWVIVVLNGVEMDWLFVSDWFDLVIFDIMLFGEDGFSLCCWVCVISKLLIIIVLVKGEDID